jgi:hypothetical protein
VEGNSPKKKEWIMGVTKKPVRSPHMALLLQILDG